ncbi:MAG: AAA family ATPase [Bacteroidia bacterium]
MSQQQPLAILVSGLPGSGKTYFAKRLAPALGACYFSTDVMRKTKTPDRTYSYAERASVYQELLDRVDKTLHAAQTVVMDATFYKKELRDAFEQAAVRAMAKVVWIEVVADEEVVKERLSHPREDSEADYAIYLKMKAEHEPIQETHLVLHSDQSSVEDMIGQTRAWLEGKQ